MNIKLLVLPLAFALATSVACAEGFDDVPALFATGGWAQVNNSQPQDPAYANPWVQGDPTNFTAYQGPDDSYISIGDYAAGTLNSQFQGTISAWLFTPTQTYQNGDVVSFATRTLTGSTYADRLQVLLSTNGSSTNVGNDAYSTGDFGIQLEDINPSLNPTGYPDSWSVYTATISGLSNPISGRIAFRYFVTDGGPGGMNSNLIGIDSYNVQSVPEPMPILVLSAGMFALLRRKVR